ncbi:MAG TPA: hypothetical protein VNT60_04735 [Deinococcales bacterium]|nr:hypothetical protein [Deinococcales bacterium]
MVNRRDFIRLAGAALGGTLITSCGVNQADVQSAAPGPQAQLPNGFQFFNMKDSGQPLPGGALPENYRLDAVIYDGASGSGAAYGAVGSDGRVGLYGAAFDLSGSTPRLAGEAVIIRTGDQLDGKVVRGLDAFDSNLRGDLAIVVKTDGEYKAPKVDERGRVTSGEQVMPTQTLYLRREGRFQRLLGLGDRSVEGHELYGIFHDVDLHDDGRILVVAEYGHKLGDGRLEARNGIFTLSGGDPATTRLVLSNARKLAQTLDAPTLSRFGLVDLHDRGHFVAQAITDVPQAGSPGFNPQSLGGGTGGGTVLVRGSLDANLASPNSVRVLASSEASAGRATQSAVRGLNIMGPRSGPGYSVAHVLHASASEQAFVRDGQVVARSGELSPSGDRILSFVSPVMGSGGEMYFVVVTEAGFELCAQASGRQRTLLRTGDKLANDARAVGGIHLGYVTSQVDGAGRLAFTVTFQDGTAALVLGLPV